MVVAYVAAAEALVRLGLSGDLLTGAFVVPAILLGPAVAWGGAVGVLFRHLPAGSISGWTVIVAGEAFGLSYGVYALWGRVGFLSTGARPVMSSLRQVAEYLVAVCVAPPVLSPSSPGSRRFSTHSRSSRAT